MEIIKTENKNAPVVVVDYAHTPDALETAIKSIRPQVKGKLWVVFGCGGDRDATKRPLMGKIANDLADIAVVADDNPRTEDATKIREQIMAACPTGKNIGDRAQAIAYAIRNAGQNDVVLLAGKGHESGQIIGKETIAFDDRDVARGILSA